MQFLHGGYVYPKEWPSRAEQRKTTSVAVWDVAAGADSAQGGARVGGDLEQLLKGLMDGQSEVIALVRTMVESQAQLGQAIGDVKKVASQRHQTLDVVTERLEAAVNEMKSGREARPTEDQLKPLSEMANRLEAAANDCLSASLETIKSAAGAGAEAGKSVVEAHAAVTETSRTQLLASIDGRLQSIEQAFADALANGAGAHDQAASVAREVTAKACVELGVAASALRASTKPPAQPKTDERISVIERGIGTLLGRRPAKIARVHEDSLEAIEDLVERRCARIVKRIAALAKQADGDARGRSRQKAAVSKGKAQKVAGGRRRTPVTAKQRSKAAATRR